MKSIYFMLAFGLAGIFMTSCKDASSTAAETSSETAQGTITSDSLKAIQQSMLESMGAMENLLKGQVSSIETTLAGLEGGAKDEMNALLEKTKKLAADVEAAKNKMAGATDATFAQIAEEVNPVLYDVKAMLRANAGVSGSPGSFSTQPSNTTTQEKK